MQKNDFCGMFTGIIEAVGEIKAVYPNGTNISFWVTSALSASFTIDQSVSHNGVCLTVEAIEENQHKVTAVAETLEKTNLSDWKPGSFVNLERSLLVSNRLDGHFVQGHVDTTGTCTKIKDRDGSFEYEFEFPKKFAPLVIEKGSISINGISLTVFDVGKDSFKVAIIPYTYEHTNLKFLDEGALVNLEFDMIGKYILRNAALNKR